MALQNSLTLPASTVALKGLNSWPMIFLSSCIARFLLLSERNALTHCGGGRHNSSVIPSVARDLSCGPKGPSACGLGMTARALLEAADDGHARHVLARRAAEIVGHGDLGVLELAGAGAALELQVHLVEHPEARGADRMAEAFQAAVDLAGNLAVRIVEAVEHVLPAVAGLGDVQVFHGDE